MAEAKAAGGKVCVLLQSSINASAHSIVLDAAAAQVQFKITGVPGHLPDTKNHDKRTAQIALTLSSTHLTLINSHQ